MAGILPVPGLLRRVTAVDVVDGTSRTTIPVWSRGIGATTARRSGGHHAYEVGDGIR